jgi:hypothetical protein
VLVSSVGCLKIEVVCLLITVSIPDDLLSIWKDKISVLLRLKLYHEWKVGCGLVWHCWFGSMISHTTFYRNEGLF